MSEPEGGEEEDRDESTSERTESERGSLPQRRYSRRHRHRGGGSPEERERERRFTDEMERDNKDVTRERKRLFRRALSSLLGSIEASAAARACHSPVLTLGFYDYFLRFIGAVFDSKGADAIISFEKSMLAGLESLPEAYQQRMASMMEQVQIRDSMKGIFIALLVLACMAFLQLERSNQSKIFADDSRDWFVRFPVIVAAIGSGKPHNRAVARKIQNMGWRADGGLWLLVRGGGLYLSKGTGLTEEFEEVPVQSRGFDSSKHNKELKDQASDVGVLLADTDGIFHSIKSRSEQERKPDASTNKTSSEGSKYTVTDNIEDDNED
ncbi:Photosystem II stability/assembly factor [Arachis hypogaea]|nr:Photosystem II stability/assembly factor [Arachis hypogaea]